MPLSIRVCQSNGLFVKSSLSRNFLLNVGKTKFSHVPGGTVVSTMTRVFCLILSPSVSTAKRNPSKSDSGFPLSSLTSRLTSTITMSAICKICGLVVARKLPRLKQLSVSRCSDLSPDPKGKAILVNRRLHGGNRNHYLNLIQQR